MVTTPADALLYWLLLWAGLAAALVGALLLRRGRFARRRGTTPHCAQCDYDLTGIVVTRCPECGRELDARTIAVGDRVRRPRLAAAGALLLLLGLSLVVVSRVPQVRAIDWYKYKPTRWVIDDLRSPSAPTAARAWTEIESRTGPRGQHLSADHLTRLTDVAFWSASGNGVAPTEKILAFLSDRFDRLPSAQQDQLVRALLAAVARPPRPRAMSLVTLDLLLPRFSPAQHALLAEAALAEQAAARPGPHRDWLINHLAARALAPGALTPAQEQRFYDQLLPARLEVRPTMVAGEELPYLVHTSGVGPSQNWWRRTAGGKIRVDGKVVQDNSGSSSSSSSFGGGSTGSWVKFKDAGPHTLEITCTLQVYTGAGLDEKKSVLRHERTVTLSAPFEALAAAPPGYITWIDDPSLTGAVRNTIRLRDVHHPSSKQAGFEMMVDITAPPVDLAFDVLVRVNGREYPVGATTIRKGANSGFHVSDYKFKSDAPITSAAVIFRSSETAARRTTWCFAAWKGEVVFENVRVTRRK